jgi:hypothetical protein
MKPNKTSFIGLTLAFTSAILPANGNAASKVVAKKPHKLAVLAYMNGFEKVIDPVVEKLINKMELVGSTDEVAIVAEWGSLRTHRVQRLFIEKDADTNIVHSRILRESDENMGSADSFKNFLTWAAREYPSEKVIVIIGGHGRGWANVLYDSRHDSKIPIPEFAKALKAFSDVRGQKTDLLVFDSCVMSAVEVASEIAPSVHYMVGGIDKLPDDVWIPYDVALNEIISAGTTDPRIAGAIFSRAYFEETKDLRHSDGILGIQFGVINLNLMMQIEKLASRLSASILDLSPRDRQDLFTSLNNKTQTYFVSYYRDLGDVLWAVPREPRFGQVVRASEKLRAVVLKATLYQSKTPYYPRATGLSLSFVPEGKYLVADWQSLYPRLRWAKRTGWDRVLLQVRKDQE